MADEMLAVAKKLAKNVPMKLYLQMVELTNPDGADATDNVDPNDESEINLAGTVCDLVAYCLMVCGAGVKRVEDMKAAANERKEYAVVTQNPYKDRANVFGPVNGAAAAFEAMFTAWSKLEGNGVAQIKVFSNAGPHTFFVERYMSRQPTNDETPADVNLFRFYQAYWGVYRLSDYLGIADDGKYVVERVTFNYPNHTNPPPRWRKKKNKGLSKQEWNKQIDEQREKNIATEIEVLYDMTKRVGCGKELTWEDLHANVLAPCMSLLEGGLKKADYHKTFGAVANYGELLAHYLVVMMCDSVDPNAFGKNSDLLAEPTDAMTAYVLPKDI